MASSIIYKMAISSLLLSGNANLLHAKASTLSLSFLSRSPIVKSSMNRMPLRPTQKFDNTPSPHIAGAEPTGCGMSSTASAISLTKNIVGAGILSLPAGIAAGQGTGQVTAVALTCCSCLLSTYSFNLIGRTVDITNAQDFRALWAQTVGRKSAWLVDFFIFGVCGGALLVYSCFLGDIFMSLVPLSRTQALLTSSALLLPLILLPDMSALAPLSSLGIAAVLYTTVFIVKRCLEGGGTLPLPIQPQLQQLAFHRVSFGTAFLFNMLSTAFLAHTNGVRFFNEMRERTVANFRKVSLIGFGTSALLYVVVMLAGYRTFGAASEGLILNNYATGDLLCQVARAATAVSIIASYPLVFTSLRDVSISSLSSMIPRVHSFKPLSLGWIGLSIALLSSITAVAVTTSDVGFVVSLVGSLFGSSLIYCAPSIMFLRAAQNHNLQASYSEVLVVRALLLFGVASTILGTAITCSTAT